jgi:tRNA 2-selenouridine synthase
LPARFCYQVICGTTGSGKSRLLQRLHEANAQVLDLERLAQHRGSVLGALPEQPQPSQKWFESQIWSALRAFDPQQPVYVESESSKVGNLRVPPHLLEAMRAAECRHLQLPVPARVRLLREEYLHFERDPDALCRQLACLIPQHGHACVSAWQLLARAARWDELVENLLVEHYDPAYRRSLARNFAARDAGDVLQLAAGSDAEFIALAQSLTQSHADAKAPITSASQIAPAEATRRIEA